MHQFLTAQVILWVSCSLDTLVAQKPKQLGTKAALRGICVGLVFLPVAEPFNQKWAQEGKHAPLGVVSFTVGKFMGEDRHFYAWR